ncbi:MAG: biotin--[acetyl-CoA-carboxylase] ligase [Cytophagales bacterium]
MFFFNSELSVLPTCESTHECLKWWLKTEKVKWGTVLMTTHQTQGIGMQGTKWLTNKDENLTISFSLLTESKVEKHLSMIVSLAVRDMIAEIIGFENIVIKWPNDLLVFDGLKHKKICGILIEKLIVKDESGFLIGIGLNVNQSVFEGIEACSLFLVSKKKYNLLDTAFKLKKSLEMKLVDFFGSGMDVLKEVYTKNLLGYGEKRLFKKDGHVFEGVVIGVNEAAELCLEVENKMVCFKTKEIQWLI